MAKVDLRHAYRSVHINPNNYQATGLKWKFKGAKKFTYFVDTRLPCGGRRAPGIFNRLTQAVKRMMASRGYIKADSGLPGLFPCAWCYLG